ncbi:MAG: hypothetical protein KDD61_15840 [Bdellovibrionales bacterium]|nr:hypothetical protein [Bdellovibrionales bacterium]
MRFVAVCLLVLGCGFGSADPSKKSEAPISAELHQKSESLWKVVKNTLKSHIDSIKASKNRNPLKSK